LCRITVAVDATGGTSVQLNALDSSLQAILNRCVPAPAPEPAAEKQAPPRVRLVEKHRCQHSTCKHALPLAIERSEATVVCPACRNATSVYALVFRCELCAALLESPRVLHGVARSCPACTRSIRVPQLELRDRPPWPDHPDYFACDCPSCQGRLVARRGDVGERAVCSHCRVIVVVPSYGTSLRAPSPVVDDPRDVLHSHGTVLCANHTCGAHIPVEVNACPICKQPNRLREYPV